MTLPTPRSSRFVDLSEDDVPVIDSEEDFNSVVHKLSNYVVKAIDAAYSYEQLRTTIAGQSLRSLALNLSQECQHSALIAALLATRYCFDNNNSEDPKLSESRAVACELIAYDLVLTLSERELIDQLLSDLPPQPEGNQPNGLGISAYYQSDPEEAAETSPLLRNAEHNHVRPNILDGPPRRGTNQFTNLSSSSIFVRDANMGQDGIAQEMAGLNALEIGAVANCKKFMSQKPVQAIIEDIWNGNIIFWEDLNPESKKVPRLYNPRTADPFTRLRVPKYQKAFQVAFFVIFLAIYLSVVFQHRGRSVTVIEVVLCIFIAAFALDEWGELRDAGLLFYQTDFWSIWDLGIILVGFAFSVTRVVGIAKRDDYITDMAFDILSMAALFLVPRICSIASLNPYFGSLLPVLKEMTTAFCKFLPVIVVLYLGFLSTFAALAKDRLSLNEVSWLLVKVFFGSSYLGFDFAVQISPIFGYTLMVIFVALTNILLITALVSLVSNSLTEVMAHANTEFKFGYSIYVLESCTSRRLTYFLPPTNLIPLLFVRSLRLVLPSTTVRRIRIALLRAVSIPFVASIWLYEGSCRVLSYGGQNPPLARLRPRPLSSSKPSGNKLGMVSARNKAPSAVTSSNDSKHQSLHATDSSELIALVQKLSTQVDELTAMVASQRSD